MKVLIIGSRVPFPLRDGGAIATYNLLKGLSDKEITVDFITLNTSKHFVDSDTFEKEFSFLNYCESFFIDTTIKPLMALKNIFSKGSYNVERFTNPEFARRIQNLCDSKQYDIIHFEGLFVAQYLPMIQTKAVKLLRQHNIEYAIWKTLAATKKGLMRRYLEFLTNRLYEFEKAITPQFDALVSITESDRIASIYMLGFKNTIATIPAGIIYESTKVQKTNSSYLYHIGSMEWMPNIEAMEWFKEQIWPLILEASPVTEFFMAGKHMPKRYQYWNSERFHVNGEVESVEQFSADKSILVVPLRSGSGIRIKTIEAMMAGKAVVTTTQGAMGLDVKTDVHCLIADEPQDFAKACIRLMDLKFRNEIAKNGQEYAQSHFGNEAVSAAWLNFYGSLLRKV
ncbi:MAG: glycosyltransferase family 4 protein [Chitinophagaceae bacterium]